MTTTPPEGNARAAETSLLPRLEVKSYIDLTDTSQASDGKFVLLINTGILHVVLSPVSKTPYHANIVYQYLEVEGRGHVEAVSSSGCRILTPGWKVQGGGYFETQHWLHALIFSGKSTAFGKYHDALLQPFSEDIPEFLGLRGYFLEMK